VTTPVQVATRFGLDNADAIQVAAKRAGLPFAVACALMEKESGGRNIYGHDAGGAGPHGQPVTEANYRRFIAAVLDGATSNGVGPAQITWAGSLVNGKRDGGFFTIMQDRGLRPWVPVDNMRFGFELLAGYHAQTGSWIAAGERYNGAREYGVDLAKKIAAWRLRLKEVAPPTSDLRVVAHNLHAGAGNDGPKKARGAVNLMDDEAAAIGVFTEAKTTVKTLRTFGVRVLGETPRSRDAHILPEEGDTVIAVDGVKVRRWWTAVQNLRFLVRSKDRWHDPRRDQVAMLKGRVRGVWAMHGPPGGPDSVNGKAWRQQMDDALKWVVRRGCRAIVGDINANAETVRKYAEERGYDVVVEGRGPDLVIVANGTVKHHNLGDQGPSFDHMAGRYDISADRK
jgi:hypothetical protein